MTTPLMVLAIFLVVDTAFLARIVRRETRVVRRSLPRWHGPKLVFSMTAVPNLGNPPRALRAQFHARLDRWLDEQLARDQANADQAQSRLIASAANGRESSPTAARSRA
jgi:hypothetical protein